MKILIVNKFLYPNGGSETYIFKIGKQLQAMGHEVQYFGMEHEGRVVGNEADIYTKPIDFHSSSRAAKLTMPFKILYSTEAKSEVKRLLSVFHADVVHLNNINFQLTPSVIDGIKEFDPSIRIIYTAHDAQWVCPNHLMQIPSTGEVCKRCIDGKTINCTKYSCIHGSRFRSLLGTMEAELYRIKKTYALVDKIVCPSDFFNQTLSHNPQLAGRTITIHNFVDRTSHDSEKEMDESHTLTESLPSKYVLYFGRFTKEKGVATLLEVCRSLSEIPFVFAGRGELEGEVNTLPNVINVGFQGESMLARIIQRAAFTVFPSEWYENGPFTVIESIMNGTPILASDIGGTSEMIAEGETGELFEAGNGSELTQKVCDLYKDDARILEYHENCLRTVNGEGTIRFTSLDEYCKKLVDEVYQ